MRMTGFIVTGYRCEPKTQTPKNAGDRPFQESAFPGVLGLSCALAPSLKRTKSTRKCRFSGRLSALSGVLWRLPQKVEVRTSIEF